MSIGVKVRGKTDKIFTPSPSTSLRTCFVLPHPFDRLRTGKGEEVVFDTNRNLHISTIEFIKANVF